MVAYALHEPYHAVVSHFQTPFPVQYALAHRTIHYCIRLRQKHKTYVSRLLQQKIQLSEVNLILRLLP